MNSRRLLTVVLTLATLTVNALANILPFNGQTTGAISDRFPIRFVPAGYVFSIWGLIYIGLIAFAIYQALPAQRNNKILDSIAPLYWLASIANAVWIFLWHYEYFSLTILVMLILLVALIAIYRRLHAAPTQGAAFRWCVLIPFSVYLGWISVATIANAAQLLYFLNWDGFGFSPELWATIMLLVAAALSAILLLRQHDRAYALVLVWAFAGIAVKQADSALVADSAWVLAALMLLGVVFGSLKPASRPKSST